MSARFSLLRSETFFYLFTSAELAGPGRVDPGLRIKDDYRPTLVSVAMASLILRVHDFCLFVLLFVWRLFVFLGVVCLLLSRGYAYHIPLPYCSS